MQNHDDKVRCWGPQSCWNAVGASGPSPHEAVHPTGHRLCLWLSSLAWPRCACGAALLWCVSLSNSRAVGNRRWGESGHFRSGSLCHISRAGHEVSEGLSDIPGEKSWHWRGVGVSDHSVPLRMLMEQLWASGRDQSSVGWGVGTRRTTSIPGGPDSYLGTMCHLCHPEGKTCTLWSWGPCAGVGGEGERESVLLQWFGTTSGCFSLAVHC